MKKVYEAPVCESIELSGNQQLLENISIPKDPTGNTVTDSDDILSGGFDSEQDFDWGTGDMEWNQ